ncbi:MAG: hypothetical protein ACI8XM_002964 [Haloarculaceae archaeon]|jgi:hypothetical protein
MTPDADDDLVTVDVRMPSALLDDIDAYALAEGHETPDAVVREALDRLE